MSGADRGQEKRFFAKVQKSPTCWKWTGARTSRSAKGYGQFSFNGKTITAHRAAYMMFVGAVPPNIEVCHKCDVRLCVNPSHLFLGTRSDNMADCAKKGRFANQQNPESTATRVLTKSLVIALRTSLSKVSMYLMAERFKVHPSCIAYARNGTTWKHLNHIVPPVKGRKHRPHVFKARALLAKSNNVEAK